MPLSEHEQKLLDQMERALYAEDPSFATQMKGHGRPGGTSRTRLVGGIIVAVLGLAVVVLGVNAASIPLGVVGFVIMVAGVAWAMTPPRGSRSDAAQSAAQRQGPARPAKGTKKARNGGSFLQKMDDRWEKRRREGL
jgi:hypothetical protein